MPRYLVCFLAAVFKSKSRLVAENLWGANCNSSRFSELNRNLHPTGKWWSQAGSNRRPLQCHCSALPAELWPHFRLPRPCRGGGRTFYRPARQHHRNPHRCIAPVAHAAPECSRREQSPVVAVFGHPMSNRCKAYVKIAAHAVCSAPTMGPGRHLLHGRHGAHDLFRSIRGS